MKRRLGFIALVLGVVCSGSALAAEPTGAQLEHFEQRIRPVLVEKCYACHNSTKLAEGGLALDDRPGLLKGGDNGPIVVPGKPAESRLLPILRHEVKDVKMPEGLGKLDDRVIADFETWIATGAADPRDKPLTAAELAQTTSWEAVLQKRKQWWSFQPIKDSAPPNVASNDWSQHPIDRFVLEKLRDNKLEAAPPADARTLVRRLFFALVGLPPTPGEAEQWMPTVQETGGVEKLVDHLLDSPHFGERWARHWMDWLRYAESHGSEGDPTIEAAWLYRDYLIRALNADVPYDQLVREHVAGDLLPKPRLNEQLGLNESAIGPAHWRMVFHGFAPTDALDEKARYTDDQINTFSKAFLGLTVSCARCHDHKFDPISQADYYALSGVLNSCRLSRVAVDTPQKLNANRAELTALKQRLRPLLAETWQKSAADLPAQLMAADGAWKGADKPHLVLHVWNKLRQETAAGATFADAWQKQVTAADAERQQRTAHAERKTWRRWQLNEEKTYKQWIRQGNGLPQKPSAAGEFAVATSGDIALAGIYPAGVYSHALSTKHAARLTSEDVRLDGNYDLWVRAIGEGGSATRYVVQDYPRNGTVYPVTNLSKDWQWVRFDMTYWNADDIHVELTTGKDAPLLVNNDARSWFGVREALIVPKGEPGPPAGAGEFLDPLFATAADAPPKSFEDLAALYAKTMTSAAKAWQAGTATDAQACWLDACLKQDVLPNKLAQLATAKALVEEYRRLEEAIAVPTRAPGLEEAYAHDQPLLERGDHKRPQQAVPRRFLEAIDPTPFKTAQSGRMELAESLLSDNNPLTRRVIVNRLWHHLFGQGLVVTPDNFGRLGEPPTHPELLDYLASRFHKNGSSLKDTLRFIVTSKTWQMSSRPSPKAQELDPTNRLLSHAFIRRLEAEAIRDSLLTVSGGLQRDLYGGPVDGNSARRSVYVRVQRNALDPFLRAFDFPEPFSAVGRRDATNVPAQSLTLMNDDRVAALAGAWAARVIADPQLKTDNQRIASMFFTAFARPAQPAEVQRFQTYLAETKTSHQQLTQQVAGLRQKIAREQTAVNELLQPIQKRLLEAVKKDPSTAANALPKPIGRWEFEGDLKDVIGTAHGKAFDGARLESGALVVKPQQYVITAPVAQALKEKTLEAWVQLDDLDQRGGGVMTVQSPDGVTFDAIVFGEQNPQQWMAGSDGFSRTSTFDGPREQEATTRAAHLAITYHADGQIAGYRDGLPYGKPYKSKGPQEFAAGKAVVGFGVRHLPAGGNRMLSGKILRAQLYDRALLPEEVQASSQAAPYFVTEAQVLAELTAAEREKVAAARERMQSLEREIEALGSIPAAIDERALWQQVAHAMFTFQEFIYVK
jgi:hypothetical protein